MSPASASAAAPTVPESSVPRLLTGRQLTWAVAGFCLLVLGIAWGAVILELRSKRDEAIAAEVRQNVNLARALQEQTVRVLAALDQATLRMRDQVVQGRFRPQDAERFANETGLAPDILTQLSYVGPDGRFVGSNIDPTGEKTGHVDLSEREHIRAHLQPGLVRDVAGQFSRSGLFVGKPVLGKVSGKWTIQFSRAIVDGSGRKLGVVVASLNPRYLEQVYGQVHLGSQGVVSLIGEDLSVRVRVAGGEASGMGTLMTPAGFWTLRPVPQEGNEIRASALDGIERIIAHRRVGDYPLQILVGTTTDAALAQWRETRAVALVLTGLLTVAVVAVALVFLRSVRQLAAKNLALQASEAQAQSANQAKSEFLAAVSHELRTPLTSIRGFSELMERRLEDPRFREQAGLIRKASEHLNALLTEILDLSKVEAGAMTLNPEPQDLVALLQATVDFFAVSAAGKGLQLSLHVAPDAPRALVCDGLRLKQILNNLLSNAMKFTQQGGVRLELDATPEQVRVHVVDTGPGVAPEQQELIFERFRQGHGRISYEHGGTGLGLALSRALAELMGGTLTVQSSPGQGARFTLSLPRRA